MIVKTASAPMAEWDVNAVVVGHYEDAGFAAPEQAGTLGELVQRLVERGEFAGKSCEVFLVPEPAGFRSPLAAVVGLGKKQELDRGSLLRSAAAATKQIAKKKRGRVGYCLGESLSDELAVGAVCGALIGSQGQDLFRAEKKLHPMDETWWWGVSAEAIERGRRIGQSINFARQLVNQPPNLLYPAS